MKIFLLIFMLIASTNAYSQERQTIIKLFSGYSSHSEEAISRNVKTTYKERGFDLLKSSSIAFQKKNHFHEIEINKILIAKKRSETTQNGLIINGAEITTTSVKFRYSYNYIINDEAKIKWVVGIAMSPYFEKDVNRPLISIQYDRIESYFGATFEVVPRIQYQISDKFLIEFNVPIPLFNVLFEKQKILNPALTIKQQKSEDLSHSFFDTLSQASLGVGYLF